MTTITKTSVTVDELKQMLDSGEPFVLLDVRNDDEFERWRIEGRYPFETVHIPYFAFLEDEAGSIARVPKDRLDCGGLCEGRRLRLCGGAATRARL
jgi:rhodanese-related sulfurtransferase